MGDVANTSMVIKEEKQWKINHRKILDSTKGTFVDTMHLDQKVLQYLQENSVLNNESVCQVLCRPSRPDKVKCLIGLLRELGPHSLLVFMEALRYTDQHFLANILASQVS